MIKSRITDVVKERLLVHKEEIDEFAADVRCLEYDDFVMFTTEALTGRGTESIYKLVDHGNGAKVLFWKRKIRDTEQSVRKVKVLIIFK